ncbi:MAG: tRNA guanosine(15) transglycosylase TgtA [Halobacteriaceae archaeon]
MSEVFELRAQDGAGRIGELSVPRADQTVRTPALMPVINPNVLTLAPATMESMGAQICITNAYIISSTEGLRERALSEGLHDLLDFDGAIVTDSGSFQLAEYGEIDTTTEEILAFQRDIGSDIGTPVDLPTPPDADRETAAEELAETKRRLETAAGVDVGEMLRNAPIQGSAFPDLRREAAQHAADLDLDIYPVGAAVPLLEQYRYDDVIEIVAAAKEGVGPAAPVHLFGAGHPMVFALAAAVGCDLFDSAAYALYARDGRYLTVRGTEHLEDLQEFPCACGACTSWTPGALREEDAETRERVLAEHNLHVSLAEMRRVREAIHRGQLFELVATRASAHPRLVDGHRALLDQEALLESGDPASKATFFHTVPESARRPEVRRHHERLGRLEVTGEVLLTEGADAEGYDVCWSVTPPFGPHPRALSRTYPLTAETPARMDRSGREAAADGVAALVGANPDAEFTLCHRGWHETALGNVPEQVYTIDISEDSATDSATAGNKEGS